MTVSKKTRNKKKEIVNNDLMIQENVIVNMRDNYYDASRTIWVTGEINEFEQHDNIKWLHYYNDGTKRPVNIIVNSFGGDIYMMNAIIDLMDELKNAGVEVRTMCIGTAMSAAALILANGTKGKRYVSPNSTVMIHSAQSFTTNGQAKTKDVSLQAKWMERIQTSMEKILMDTTGKTMKEIKKTVEYETYFDAHEAVEFGLADCVGMVSL